MNKYFTDGLDGLKAGTPVIMGYFPIAIAFGIMAKTQGISLTHTFMFSAVVFAGASQFMALNLMSIGTSFTGIVTATFLMNLRHFLMSSAINQRLHDIKKRWLPILGFMVTDENFAVVCTHNRKLTISYFLSLQLSCYLAWVMGSIFGYQFGDIFPDIIKKSMNIALYAMFVALLIPKAKKSNQAIILALMAGALNTLLGLLQIANTSVNLILSVIISTSIGVLIFKKTKGIDHE